MEQTERRAHMTAEFQRRYGAEFCERKLVPFAAGLIVGEALTGVALTGARMAWGF